MESRHLSVVIRRDPRDVAANTIGMFLGIFLAIVLTLPATLRRNRAAR